MDRYLSGQMAAPVAGPPPIPRRDPAVPVPISFSQEQLWLHAQIANDVPLYNEPFTLRRRGPLNVSALERTLTEMVRRHEAWRTVFGVAEGQPVQNVRPPFAVHLPVTDLSQLPSVEREAKAKSLATADALRRFDMTQGPLWRALLVKMADDDHRLFMTMHHVIFDGFSTYRVFLPEVTQLYEALDAAERSPLPDLPVQYADVALWQRRTLAEHPPTAQIAYWRERLKGEYPVLQLPTDRPRPSVQTFAGATEAITFPASLSAQLREFSRREGVTLYMTLLAAFATILYRYSSQGDLVVGTVSSGRKRAELDQLLGCFQNPLALRMDLSGEPTFRAMLGRVRDVVAGALSNDDVPFEQVVRECIPGRDSSNSSVLQVFFSLVPPAVSLDPAWSISQVDVSVGAAKFDLDLELDDRPEGIQGRFVFNTGIFDAATIRRITGHLMRLTEAAVRHPEEKIALLPLLASGEEAFLAEWNRTESPYPAEKCLHQLFEDSVAANPSHIALTYGSAQLTYAQLNQRANQLARHLRRRGVGKGTTVGVCLQRGFDLLTALLAVMKSGGVCLPLDPKYPADRISYMVEDSAAPLVITQPGLLPPELAVQPELVVLPDAWIDVATESVANLDGGTEAAGPRDLAYTIYTSGSTGKPRGVQLEHRGLVNHAWTCRGLFELNPSDRMLQFATISFDISVEEIYPTLASGGTVVLWPEGHSLATADFLEFCRQQGVTIIDPSTAYWHELVHAIAEGGQKLPPSLRLVIVGGEKASSSAFASWMRAAGPSVRWINTYGPTEASVIVTAFEPKYGSPESVPTSLPIGRPIANTKIYVLDAQLQRVPCGVPGELHIGGIGVSRGYLNRPDMTEQKFIRDPFSPEPDARLYKTGDMVRLLPSGEIEFIGRTDFQVKIRGFRVELGEIETALAQHSNVHDAVVIAREDQPGTKALVAYIVPNAQPGPVPSELRGFVKDKLPEYMWPSAYVGMAALPLTPNGKVNRRALPPPEVADLAVQGEFTAAKNEVETRLVKIWENVLGRDPIGTQQNFFELGGHSLLAVRLMYRIEQEFGRNLPITALLKAPTVEQLAELLHSDSAHEDWSSLVAIQPLGSRPPLFLVHGAGGAVIVYRDLAIHLGKAIRGRDHENDLPVYGLQAQGLDGKQPVLRHVEAMASHYIEEMRRVQPEGPYRIGGLSFGGIVAWEMAQQLSQRGESVQLLALMDTFPNNTESAAELLLKLARRSFFDQMKYLLRKVGEYRNKFRRRMRGDFLPPAMLQVRAGIQEAAAAYTLRPYAGLVTVFRASEKSLRGTHDPWFGWKELAAGGIDMHVIEGTHVGILAEPGVAQLAKELRATMDRAAGEAEAKSTEERETAEAAVGV